MTKYVQFFGMASVPLLLAACTPADRPVAQAPSISAVGNELPLPTAEDITRVERAYYISPGDRLTIDVFGVPELSREVQVDSSGQLSFPLIGAIQARGLTPADLARNIETQLGGRYVRSPQVSVNLKESTNQFVTVDGQVTEPGMFPVRGQMTLVRAVALAGGTAELADVEEVVIMREVAGETYIGLYDLAAIRRGNYADPVIFPNDRVIVGESIQRRRVRDILQAAPLLSPLIFLAR